jgi:pyruvate-ferredoxin/flavodoxin oxidoreductase
MPVRDYAARELRYRMLMTSRPAEAEQLMRDAQAAVDRRWKVYEDLATAR